MKEDAETRSELAEWLNVVTFTASKEGDTKMRCANRYTLISLLQSYTHMSFATTIGSEIVWNEFQLL